MNKFKTSAVFRLLMTNPAAAQHARAIIHDTGLTRGNTGIRLQQLNFSASIRLCIGNGRKRRLSRADFDADFACFIRKFLARKPVNLFDTKRGFRYE